MSNKKEAYFKFIFPDYKYLTESNESIPFAGTVKTLCDECSSNVITYDQLKAETPKILQYNDNTGWGSNNKRSRIKHYIDQYLEIPKYFNIRDYWDNSRSQAGGITLLVSHSPEVYADSTHGYTKFTSTYDNKVVYCSVIISSGNFFYNFNLPEEVLAKSDLRDGIVSSQFHSNWYFKNDSEKTTYWDYSATIGKPINPVENREKRVFNQCYFLEGNVIALGKQYDSQTDEIVDADASIIERQTRIRNSLQCDTNDLIGLPYGYDPKGALTGYSVIREDLKKDFVDLEVTRRILYSYYNNWTDTVPTIEIPKPALSGFGYNTILAYDRPGYDDRPQEYIDHPPMPIRYDLLRNTLSNRDPYGDCETVLVMWVADRDPATVPDGDVAGLRAITWEQYAVPISVRCCVKDGGGESYSSNRFLVSYPHKSDESYYKLHTRRNDVYSQNQFKDAVYLPGLIEYSKDYVLTYQQMEYVDTNALEHAYDDIFDIQKYMFQQECNVSAVYARRSYYIWANNGHQQAYYILVKNNDNAEYRIDATQPICLIGHNQNLSDYDLQFAPSVHLPKSMYHDGEYSWGPFANENSDCWSINDNRFIALFEYDASKIETVTGKVTFGPGLKEFLDDHAVPHFVDPSTLPGTTNDWSNIYLSSLGITWECSWCNTDNLFYHVGSNDDACFPLGFLDGFIQINGVTYGRNVTSGDGAGKVVVGFKNVYDYAFDDHHHFVYDSNTDTYSLAVDSNYEYTAYVMDYNQ